MIPVPTFHIGETVLQLCTGQRGTVVGHASELVWKDRQPLHILVRFTQQVCPVFVLRDLLVLTTSSLVVRGFHEEQGEADGRVRG